MIDIVGGAQPPKNLFKPFPSEGYIRLYQIRDYGDNPIPVYIPESYAIKRTVKGDILLARYGGSLGKVFVAENGAYNVAMAKARVKYPGIVMNEYLLLFYKSCLYQDILKTISRTAQAGFNTNDFDNLFLPLPPINEQERITMRVQSIRNVLLKLVKY